MDNAPPVEPQESRTQRICALKPGEIYTELRFLEGSDAISAIDSELPQLRQKMAGNIASTRHFCMRKTGNNYRIETELLVTKSNRVGCLLILTCIGNDNGDSTGTENNNETARIGENRNKSGTAIQGS